MITRQQLAAALAAVLLSCSYCAPVAAGLCVEADSATVPATIITTGDSVVDCVDMVLLESAEYDSLVGAVQFWEVPPVESLTAAWMAGFSLPMIIYLSAWALGSVVRFVNS